MYVKDQNAQRKELGLMINESKTVCMKLSAPEDQRKMEALKIVVTGPTSPTWNSWKINS